MPWIVRVDIQDNEVPTTAVEDQVFFVVIFLRFLAQNASFLFGSLDIFYPPRCPDLIHRSYIILRTHVNCNARLP